MAQRPSKYRAYVSDSTAFQNLTNVELPDQVEIQIVLEFARETSSRQGIFQHTWDAGIDAQVINEFKSRHPGSKFFVSMGGPDDSLGKPADKNVWIANAYKTLYDIINIYALDGIDVYYTSFDSDADKDALGRVLAKLKEENKIISMVAADPDLATNYNTPLFHNIRNRNDIGTVLYQFQKGT